MYIEIKRKVASPGEALDLLRGICTDLNDGQKKGKGWKLTNGKDDEEEQTASTASEKAPEQSKSQDEDKNDPAKPGEATGSDSGQGSASTDEDAPWDKNKKQ